MEPPRYGLVIEDRVMALEHVPPDGLEDWLALGTETLERMGQNALQGNHAAPRASVRLWAPIPRARKFLGIGANYGSHLLECERLGIKPPAAQLWFNKQTSCIVGPDDDIVIPALSDKVDYEGELGVVIGRRCRNVPAQRAREVIGGYLICNDVSVRDIQMRSPTMMLGKSFDTHGPTGPWLVTPDEIADPQDLLLRTWVNGELRQSARTGEMRYSIADQIAELSSIFTLEPGDILATGTPAGVGAAMSPPRFLRAGDTVRIEIDGIGAIKNRCVADQTPIWNGT
jgi:2-keto-4-pentenoate hydratase/2-oxohepta-3-ene-1,7-dioic acid hydratase in catechol pathway